MKRWLRVWLFGPVAPNHVIVEHLEHEVARLNGAKAALEKKVNSIETSHASKRRSFSGILDDTLEAMQKEFRK